MLSGEGGLMLFDEEDNGDTWLLGLDCWEEGQGICCGVPACAIESSEAYSMGEGGSFWGMGYDIFDFRTRVLDLEDAVRPIVPRGMGFRVK